MYSMPNRSILLFGLIALLILISLAFLGTGFFYYQYRSVQSQLNRFLKNPQEALREENRQLVAHLRQIMDLPDGEEPQIEVKNDLAPFQDKPFFAKAKVGDKLIIFTKAGKAILYDPQNEKIIEVGPIVIPTPTGNTSNEESGEFQPEAPTTRPLPTSTPRPTATPIPEGPPPPPSPPPPHPPPPPSIILN